MIKRNERGKLSVDYLDVEIFFGELFEHCNTARELRIIGWDGERA